MYTAQTRLSVGHVCLPYIRMSWGKNPASSELSNADSTIIILAGDTIGYYGLDSCG